MVCPFKNITQLEQTVYKPYTGVLGVWYEWDIKNNSFISLKMLNGDKCGSHGSRNTTIFLKCGNQKTNIQNINEVSTCTYEIDLITPFSCEKHDLGYTMRVYPLLSVNLQIEMNRIYEDFSKKFITEKVIYPLYIWFNALFKFFS